ncbi:MAG: hypothetical protein ACLUNO_12815 [Oscillospiraceae bacterium]
MEKFFHLSLRGTDKKTEIIAGLTTFMTMAYVLAVQPAAICGGEAYITDVNGVVITKSAIMVTCALVSGLITLLMAFYTNFPFALSTGMGSNFILGALIQSQALSFGSAMAITLISGIVFRPADGLRPARPDRARHPQEHQDRDLCVHRLFHCLSRLPELRHRFV